MEVSGYRLLKQVGLGAGSRIVTAVEQRTGRTVAIKSVVRNTPEDDRFLEQAENEFRVASRLNSTYLRQYYQILRVRKLLAVREVILVMEFIDGMNLETARPNRLNTFLALFQRVAAGLQTMHQAGFVHSDMKPTNIMIARKGVVKIIDFGQSCPMHHRKERIQGTPDYIAPEQVKRLPLDQRTDVFNLGATMYWVLTSERYPTAIRGSDARGGINLVRSEKPTAPVELNDKIPIALSNLVMECCRENPTDRPADMKQVISRLRVIQDIWRKHRESMRTARGTTPPASDSMADSREIAVSDSSPGNHAMQVANPDGVEPQATDPDGDAFINQNADLQLGGWEKTVDTTDPSPQPPGDRP